MAKNNRLMKTQKTLGTAHQRFALRKLSVGVVSVLLGTTLFLGEASADSATPTTTQAETPQSVPAIYPGECNSSADSGCSVRGGLTGNPEYPICRG